MNESRCVLSAKLLLTIVAVVITSISCGRVGWGDELHTEPDPADPTPAATVPWSNNIGGLVLAAKAERRYLGDGEPVVIDVELKNTSGHDLQFNNDLWCTGWYLIVKDGLGHDVPLTNRGSGWVKNPQAFSLKDFDQAVTLQKGESQKYTILASAMYDFSHLGGYEIAVKRLLRFPHVGDDVQALVSNTVPVCFGDMLDNENFVHRVSDPLTARDFELTVIPDQLNYFASEPVECAVAVKYVGLSRDSVLMLRNCVGYSFPFYSDVTFTCPPGWKAKERLKVMIASGWTGFQTFRRGDTMRGELDLSRYFSEIPVGK